MTAPTPAGQGPHLVDHERDEDAEQPGYIKGTDYSLPYVSQWSRANPLDDEQKKLLRNLNCSFLSAHGIPPTLLALKQHAQALCILIQALCPTVHSAEIGTTNADGLAQGGAPQQSQDRMTKAYGLNEAFDFLADLSQPYVNNDPNHLKPLNSLRNEVRKRQEPSSTEYHCPLDETQPRGKGEAAKPYSSHQNLVMHANACLERLDHNFSATGGLMSILPTNQEHDVDQLRDARNSLLGSWILFTQHLTARMHELERSYANALDVLAGEAAIPRQYVSAMGIGSAGSSGGREIAFPQDRWVLANSGDDVFSFVHQLLDKQEAANQLTEKVHRRNGVASSYNTVQRQGDDFEYMRGVVYTDVQTRYYRLMGQGHGTVFVVPAWEHHPSLDYTKQIEHEPTIVASVKPNLPTRVSELEKRFNAGLARQAELQKNKYHLEERTMQLESEVAMLQENGKRERAINSVLSEAADKDQLRDLGSLVARKVQGLEEDNANLQLQVDKQRQEYERQQAYWEDVKKTSDILRITNRRDRADQDGRRGVKNREHWVRY